MAPKRIDFDNPPAAMKKLLACLTALGMQPDTYTGGPDSVLVFGKREDLRLACQARFTIGETPTGKVSGKFAGARVRDPLGIIYGLDVDYDYGPAGMKNFGYSREHADMLANRRKLAYNDGEQHTRNVADLDTAGALSEWLDEWLDVLKVDHKRQSPQKKKKATDLDLMLGADWIEK